MKNAIAFMTFALLFITALALRHSGYAPHWIVNVVVFAAGIYIYIESFNKYKKLRFIRDTATSKIGSLSMGLVEVYGKAKRLPGFFDIYHYLTVRELNDRRKTDFLSMPSSSKKIFVARPFYIEDETGIVFVDPMDAEIVLNTKRWKDGDYLYTEEQIKEGDYVYCIGTAQRKEPVDIAQEINKAIRDAKKSEDAIARFDIDNDGKISPEEWAAARKSIEREIIEKNLDGKTSIVNINRGKENSVFIISDKKEDRLIKKYYIHSAVLLAIGIAVTVYSMISAFRG